MNNSFSNDKKYKTSTKDNKPVFCNFEEKDKLKYSNKYNSSNKEWLSFSHQSHFLDKKLNVFYYDNAFVVSDAPLNKCFTGCAFDSELNVIDVSLNRYKKIDSKNLINERDFNNAKYYDVEAIYLGQIRNHWGSFLNDTIARLWFNLDNPENNIYAVSLTMPSVGRTMHKNIYRFFELVGIKKEQVLIIEDMAQFKRLIVPELSILLNEYYTNEYLDIFRTIRRKNLIPTSNYKKVYFSRKNFTSKTKRDFGEEEIVKFMAGNGFEIVFPEEHDLLEQIAYINGCEVFASVGGALAHNILFIDFDKPQRPVMFLFNRMNGYQWHQWLFNECVSVQLNYVDSFDEPYRLFFKTPVSGPFLFGVNRNVKRFAKDHFLKIPLINVAKRFKAFNAYSFQVVRIVLSSIKKKVLKR